MDLLCPDVGTFVRHRRQETGSVIGSEVRLDVKATFKHKKQENDGKLEQKVLSSMNRNMLEV